MNKITLLLFVVTFLLAGCKKESEQRRTVEYSIGCTDCMVAYVADQQGNQHSEYHQNSSWKYSFNAASGQQVLLMAYNTSNNYQSVTATIKQNGVVLTTQTTYCPISGVSFCVDTIQ